MKSSTASRNNYRCPACQGPTTADHKGRGFVRHKRRVNGVHLCDFERGERDISKKQ